MSNGDQITLGQLQELWGATADNTEAIKELTEAIKGTDGVKKINDAVTVNGMSDLLARIGATNDAAQTDPSQTASEVALLKGLLSVILSIKGTDGIKKIVDAVTVDGLSNVAKESTLGDVKTAVAALAALISDGRLKTEAALSGSLIDLRGLAANRPAANSVAAGTTYWSVDNGDVSVSDGSTWRSLGVA